MAHESVPLDSDKQLPPSETDAAASEATTEQPAALPVGPPPAASGPAEAETADESVPSVQSPAKKPAVSGGVHQSIQFGDHSQARDVIQATGDIVLGPERSQDTPDPGTTRLIQVLTLIVGVAGLVGGVILLMKAVPGFTPQFVLPLLVIVGAIVLGVMGILNPEQIVAILTGPRSKGPG